LGSNSFRLLLAVPEGRGWRPLVEDRVRVGLARGLDGRERLSRDAMARGLGALRRLRPHLRALGPTQVRAVATDTLRRAHNRRAFLEAAQRILGEPVEVISGTEEAALIYAGAVAGPGEPGHESQLVLDIGGGSTEVAAGRGCRPLRAESLPLGCIPLTRDYFPDGVMTGPGLEAAVQAVRRHLRGNLSGIRQHGWQQAWGASGTVEAVVGLAASLCAGAGEGRLDRHSLAAVREQLQIHADPAQRARLPGVGEARAGVLPGGFAVLLGLFDELGLESLGLARGALREGVVRGLMQDL
jgi:exopolyphosphatase/guanosine-5'-triphosphate,3'-diphosphate pyrophosphatase